MLPSLRALLSEVVDYAGLFPPAQLPLPPAFENFVRYLGGGHSGMLGRFIIPAKRLSELSALLSSASAPGPIRISALGRGGEDVPAFLDGLVTDLADINAFNATHGGAAFADAFEVRLPASVLGVSAASHTLSFLMQVERVLETHRGRFLSLSFECPLVGDWPSTVGGAAVALSQFAAARSLDQRRPPVGMKLRTGGLDASAFPTSEQVAFVVAACRDKNVPLKFTAGLHHPIRRFDPSVRTMMHGFVNLFAAGTLAHAMALELHDIQGIIDEQDAREFRFTDESLAWNDAEAMLDEIQFARRQRVLSFGSCSFDEPVDDLRALNWL